MKNFNEFEFQQYLIRDNIKKNEQRIKEDPLTGEDRLVDHNKVMFFVYLGHAMKMAKLVIMIFNITAFVGIVWFVYSKYDLLLNISSSSEE